MNEAVALTHNKHPIHLWPLLIVGSVLHDDSLCGEKDYTSNCGDGDGDGAGHGGINGNGYGYGDGLVAGGGWGDTRYGDGCGNGDGSGEGGYDTGDGSGDGSCD